MEGAMIPSYRTLDGFALESTGSKGLAIQSLDPGVTLMVKTRHSSYRIVILDGSRHLVLVEGGIFPDATVVRLCGSTVGGSALKLGWILVGLRIEFGLGTGIITSSPVQSVEIESPTDSRQECAA
jgi:hypothetical protein